MDFEWDPTKAAANRKKHDVSFADAVAVFYDDRALTLEDDHPVEERWVTMGRDSLIVCWSSSIAGGKTAFADLGTQGDAGGAAAVRGEMTMKRQYDFSGGRRGAVVKPARGKTRITIRLDDEVLDWFRQQVESAGGGNYQTLINDALREYIGRQEERLEDLLRRVLREELHPRRAS